MAQDNYFKNLRKLMVLAFRAGVAAGRATKK